MQALHLAMDSSTMSLFHRISGCTLALSVSGGLIYMQLMTTSLSYRPVYALSSALASLPAFVPVAAAGTLSLGLFYHMSNGVRHLLWDGMIPIPGLYGKPMFLSGVQPQHGQTKFAKVAKVVAVGGVVMWTVFWGRVISAS